MTSDWTVTIEKKGRVWGPTKYLWTLYEGGYVRREWWGMTRWTCRLGARSARRQIERERLIRDKRTYTL